jgi:hypothetical protein
MKWLHWKKHDWSDVEYRGGILDRSAHYRVCTLSVKCVRQNIHMDGERGDLLEKRKNLIIDGKLVHSINISIFILRLCTGSAH